MGGRRAEVGGGGGRGRVLSKGEATCDEEEREHRAVHRQDEGAASLQQRFAPESQVGTPWRSRLSPDPSDRDSRQAIALSAGRGLEGVDDSLERRLAPVVP
jgi:hypothetical protein